MAVHVFPNHESMSRAAARRVTTVVRDTLSAQDTVAIALAGGSTPRRLYQLLAEADLPWSCIHLFWGDERYVPHTHADSNVRLVRDTLLRDADVPAPNVHPMPTDIPPVAAASAYAATLHRAFARREHTFDLALLGMGADGHTASLFPEHNPSPNDRKWVRAVSAPPRHAVAQRLTCTLPVFNSARRALVLVSGAEKRQTVHAAQVERNEDLPIARIRPRRPLVWFLDDEAAPAPSPFS